MEISIIFRWKKNKRSRIDSTVSRNSREELIRADIKGAIELQMSKILKFKYY
jgi:hypothetical protein